MIIKKLKKKIQKKETGLDICSTRTSTKNELDNKEHWWPRGIRKIRMCGERDEPITHT